MNDHCFYLAGASPALLYARKALEHRGCDLAQEPEEDVTHLLLPAPGFEAPGMIRGGLPLAPLLKKLPKNITVLGGSLDTPELDGYRKADFLRDAMYLSQNAVITAHCAVKEMLNRLPVTAQDCPILVIGWGRIGKSLARLLAAMGARVSIATRKPEDRAMLHALGYGAVDTARLGANLMCYRVIFNTAPYPVLGEAQLRHCRPDCLKIDLASRPGISGGDVVWARGLPGTDAPETSGRLIAATAIRLAAAEGTL